ncbi:MAG: hypothetical protein AB1772_02870 [Candidatus Zixiibacteriota bacterium]
MRNGTILIIGGAVLLGLCAPVAGATTFEIKYLSAENVYLGGGRADGLVVGDRLVTVDAGNCRTELEIVFVADHSASCAKLSDNCTPAVGDKAVLVSKPSADTAPSAVDTTLAEAERDTTAIPQPVAPRSFSPRQAPTITGGVSLLFNHWADQSSTNLGFSQTTARLNLKVRRLFDRDITFSLRTRGRYDQRQRAYSSAVSRQAWENRIWEFSLSYDAPLARLNFGAGRILPRRVSSVGYLDGLLLETRATENLRVGLFGGSEPHWAYANDRVSVNRAGVYLSVISPTGGGLILEQSIAAVGEYHAGTVSRELFALQGRISSGSRWSIYHTAEVDINRRWRRDAAGKSLSLSSLYAGINYRLYNSVRFVVSYDNRTNYRTYETRTVVDSLFDDHLRQGVRTQVDVALPYQVRASIGYGLRKRSGDPDQTNSYSLYLSRAGLLGFGSTISVHYAAFQGPFDRGDNYSTRVTRSVSRRLQLSLGYGGYRYRAESSDSYRRSNWFEIGAQADLSRRLYLGGSAEFDSGDDIDGTRVQTELGYRF